MSTTLHAEPRAGKTKGELRQLRRGGKIPAVIYGKQMEAAAIALEARELASFLRSEAHSIVELDVAGLGSRSALLNEIQRDALNGEVLHVDFHQINLNEKIQTPVRLDFTGESPGEKEGGMLQIVMHELEVSCVAKDLPDRLTVDVSSLQLGDHLTVGQIPLPAGVTAASEADIVVVSVLAPQKNLSEDEVEAMDDAAEENAQHSKAANTADVD
ncbi:50S ribosomal protein L25 [Cohnella algarum]|uniref:50S ribosomal protein L25 n=1 Tax=Cohnella algarum TaxID=2044859 RepID=UPI0019680B70|nr:50S ribosomal protein L25 [Cohnella algarum]MBN2981223.1 50S ribosomal protein L25 [Cohnella algarum]